MRQNASVLNKLLQINAFIRNMKRAALESGAFFKFLYLFYIYRDYSADTADNSAERDFQQKHPTET